MKLNPPRHHHEPFNDLLHCRLVQPEMFAKPTSTPVWVVVAIFVAVMMTLLWSETSLAQTPPNFRVPPVELPDVESTEDETEDETEVQPQGETPRQVIVDSDLGVDDAAALIWLFSQTRHPVDVQGIVTIAGATTITNATNNAQLILSWLGEETVPVIQGADAPLVRPLSLTPSLVHGPDGLWFTFAPEVPADSADATAFYCAPQRLQSGLLVVALGPLTNLAHAIQSCPAAWSDVEIVSLGGGRLKTNQTPVTEYNYWQDPEAAQQVLTQGAASGATIQIVLADAFSQFELEPRDIEKLSRHGVPAIVNLQPALEAYVNGLSAGGETPTLPDPVAVMYALKNGLGTAHSALVKPLAGEGIPEMVRGQTIIGMTLNERITMIASDADLSAIAYNIYNTPGYDLDSAIFEILSREQDNALVVTDIEARRMHNLFLQDLRGKDINVQSGEASNEAGNFEEHLYVPLIMD